ncbi:MAG: IS21 family transposase [Intestinibacter bartlettii]|nr:IS21 family transposase [Intestinibacter bartlettii]
MISEAMKTTIKTLFEKGYNKSQISRMLQIDRKTVRAKLKESDEELPQKKTRPTILDPHKEYIQIEVNKDIQAKRIFEDLVRDYDYQGSYDTVKKYIHSIREKKSKVYMVLNTQPGEEAQVDFGYIGLLNINGKKKKAWIFVMTLSYSRYMYVQIVLDQKVQTFINCHKNAFKYFNGVPEIVKIDNLKAAILEADFYEPTIQKDYAAFAAYYGFLAQPCRVYTPTDKGKVESNVKYVKNSCFKGRNFKDIEEAKGFLATWLKDTANKRIHGTTKKVPFEVFSEIEKACLTALPKEDYILSNSQICHVATNCHICYKSNYYSVPYGYVGKDVQAIEMNGLLRIYSDNKEIALHTIANCEKGKFLTDINHYPHSKNITISEILSTQKNKMQEIGPEALRFFELYINADVSNRKYDYRAISGLLSLQKNYSNDLINAACSRAILFNSITYKTVKNILQKNIDTSIIPSSSYVSNEENSFKRDLSKYNKFLEGGTKNNE